MSKFPRILGWLLTLCYFSAGGRTVGAEEASRPNFVFILADDQAWNGTSVPMIPGKEFSRSPNFRTPNLEKLAARGVVFSQAYASHCKCECSRASLLMGRSTTSLNAPDKRARDWKAPASDSLPNTLKRAVPAYRAAHFGKWQWPQSPRSMGYDLSDGITQNEDGDTDDPQDPKQSFGITRRASAFMEQQVKDGRPFYLQLSYYAVHATPQALPSTLKKYQGSAVGKAQGKGGGDRSIMAAMTEDFDTCIGAIFKKLDDLGISKNTYVIYMSDNGGPTRILKGGKGNIFEGGIRVPLIVAGPGVRGGVYSNEPAVGYDLFATVLDLAAPGFAPPKGIEGGSWRSILETGTGRIKRPIDRIVFHQGTEVDHPQSAIRKGDFKLVHYWDTREDFLYDLSTDPTESRNLAREKTRLRDELLRELTAHVRAGLGDTAVNALERGEVGERRPPRPAAKKNQSKRP